MTNLTRGNTLRRLKQWEDLSLWQRTNDARLNELADYVVDGMDMDALLDYAKEQLVGYWTTAQEHFETEYKEFELEHKDRFVR